MEITDQLALGMPISCGDLGRIYQPTLEQLLGYGDYLNLFYPFMVGKKMFDVDTFPPETRDFDLFFMLKDEENFLFVDKEGKPLLEEMATALSFFYKTNDIEIRLVEQMVVVNSEIQITRDNFDLLCSIILEAIGKEKIVKPEEIVFKSERLRKLHEKLERNREIVRKRNAILVADMINVLAVNTVRGFTYEEIRNMTMWQLYKNYAQVMVIDSHEQMMKYKTSEKYNVEDEVSHWAKTNKMQRIEV